MKKKNKFFTAIKVFRIAIRRPLSKIDKATKSISFSAGNNWTVTIKKNATA